MSAKPIRLNAVELRALGDASDELSETATTFRMCNAFGNPADPSWDTPGEKETYENLRSLAQQLAQIVRRAA
jgi:hypothetical protein